MAAIRLTFKYKDGVLELDSQMRVDMIVPPGDPLDVPLAQGFWAELRDARDRVVYRRQLVDAMPVDVEVFSDTEEESIARAPVIVREGAFSVVVPEPDLGGYDVVLMSSEHAPAPAPQALPRGLAGKGPVAAFQPARVKGGAAQELARFRLAP